MDVTSGSWDLLSRQSSPASTPSDLSWNICLENALLFVDQSHRTVSHIGAPARGDHRRKIARRIWLRLPSRIDIAARPYVRLAELEKQNYF
jgi:excinuclease UvrABC helicase subunit UvrB